MTGTTASTITARSAHREWATRSPDERLASVHALHEAARARRLGTMERRIDAGALGTMAVTDNELALRHPVYGTAPLTHWSFEQLATIAGAPPNDVAITRRLQLSALSLGLDLHDQLIAGAGGQYFSFREAGLLGTGLEEIVATCGARPTQAPPHARS
jgi:hypothetical protein